MVRRYNVFMLDFVQPHPGRVRVLVYAAPKWMLTLRNDLRVSGVLCHKYGNGAIRVDKPEMVVKTVGLFLVPERWPELFKALEAYAEAWAGATRRVTPPPGTNEARLKAAMDVVLAAPAPAIRARQTD